MESGQSPRSLTSSLQCIPPCVHRAIGPTKVLVNLSYVARAPPRKCALWGQPNTGLLLLPPHVPAQGRAVPVRSSPWPGSSLITSLTLTSTHPARCLLLPPGTSQTGHCSIRSTRSPANGLSTLRLLNENQKRCFDSVWASLHPPIRVSTAWQGAGRAAGGRRQAFWPTEQSLSSFGKNC